MKGRDIRENFVKFFENKEHRVVQSAPMVIKNDPTLMFTNAGMNQFKEIFLGYKASNFSRAADFQKCLRVSGKHNDLEEVGHDNYHHTMFEMLGNWSFNDYFKKEAIGFAWELLIDVYKIPSEHLYVTIFGGDDNDHLEKDTEAFEYWKEYLPEERILSYGKKDNFWEMGDTGPCGPCSEIHIDLRPADEQAKQPGHELVNQNHPLVIELWNLVFIQFNRKSNGTLELLPQKHIDTGMGLERLCMVLQDKHSAYETDLFLPLIKKLEQLSGISYGADNNSEIAFRVIADHLRAVSFAIADGELPSNTGAGYVIRRVLRRAVRYAYTYLKLDQPVIFELVPTLVQIMGTAYPELESQQQLISKVIKEEELSFLKTLANGIQLLDQLMNEAKQNDEKEINGESAFKLYDTYGFPFDLTRLILNENGFSVDEKTFREELQKQKTRSRDASITDTEDWVDVNNIEDTRFVGYDELSTNVNITKYRKAQTKGNVLYQLILDKTPFYSEGGGQIGDTGYLESENEKIQIIDTKKENNLLLHVTKMLPRDISSTFNAVVDTEKRSATANNHSATHLMHHALRQILGSHVEQKGSFVHPDYLRFDFSHFQKLSEEEIRKVEQLVNKKIRDNIRLEEKRNIPLEEAKKHGAVAFFGEKYGESVRTVKFGDSYELCGGTHVQATGQIGLFKIISESSVAAGIRRIEAITGVQAEKYLYDLEDKIKYLNELLKNPRDLARGIKDLLKENNDLHKQAEAFEREKIKHVKNDLLQKMQPVNGINLIVENISFDSVNTIKNLAFQFKNEMDDVVLVIGSVINNRPNLAIMIPDKIVENKQINAGTIIREASKEIKGGGGGQPFFATAGGKDPNGINAALKKAKELILDAIG